MTGMVNHFSPYLTKHNKKTKTYMMLEIGTDTKMWLVKTGYWDANPPLLDNWISSSLSLNSLNTKRGQHMTLEIQVLAWDRHKNVAG